MPQLNEDQLRNRAHLINELSRVETGVKPHQKATVHAQAYRAFPQFRKQPSDLDLTDNPSPKEVQKGSRRQA